MPHTRRRWLQHTLTLAGTSWLWSQGTPAAAEPYAVKEFRHARILEGELERSVLAIKQVA